MELMDLRSILKELQKQGFEVEYDEDNRGRMTIIVFNGHRFVTTFSTDRHDWRSRLNSLSACRRAGFIWPD